MRFCDDDAFSGIMYVVRLFSHVDDSFDRCIDEGNVYFMYISSWSSFECDFPAPSRLQLMFSMPIVNMCSTRLGYFI